ncbi:MAG: hypothetical protein J0L72_10485 [Armatimonadetes bacterium]|nr:hypothetical protein [Armatimonadota bacterium]
MATVKTPGVFEGYSGKLGNLVFRQTPQGTQMIERVRPKQPNTPAQMAVRERMRQAGKAWRGMTLEQAMAWKAYAQQQGRDPRGFVMDANNVFIRLAVRVLQVNPNAEIPLVPPSTPFSGDAVAASLSAAPGAVNLPVTQGNAPGVVTEVLVQRLASVHRAAYPEKFRSAGFSAWASGGMVSVPLSPGVYAVAIRTVKSATGQSGQLMELGRAVVS